MTGPRGPLPDPPTCPMRVLCVDDHVDACTVLGHLLRLYGYSVQTAHTGPAALQVAVSWRPDVVLLDIGLPEINGYEVARRLRQHPRLKNVRLVALTGYGMESDLQLARESGFDAHLLKPVDPPELERFLAGWNDARSSNPA